MIYKETIERSLPGKLDDLINKIKGFTDDLGIPNYFIKDNLKDEEKSYKFTAQIRYCGNSADIDFFYDQKLDKLKINISADEETLYKECVSLVDDAMHNKEHHHPDFILHGELGL